MAGLVIFLILDQKLINRSPVISTMSVFTCQSSLCTLLPYAFKMLIKLRVQKVFDNFDLMLCYEKHN